MRNIFLFIRRFFVFFMFLFLQGLSFAILINYNKTYEAVFANNANEITGVLDKQYNDIESYFSLKKKNELLQEQNARLLGLLGVSREAPDTTVTTIIDSLIRDTSGRVQRFRFFPAKVVNNSVSEENNYITLYRGSKQGVRKDMGVTGPQGIVGHVILVSDNFCRVMSLLNHNSRVSAMLKDSYHTGIVDWDGADPSYVTLHNISKSAKVKIGDTVVTSNLSGNYPPGLLIGRVSAIETDPSTNFYTLKVKTATNFYSLQYAYLIDNVMWEEQHKLEALTPKNQ
jgi:rod shape-determining protein MreC